MNTIYIIAPFAAFLLTFLLVPVIRKIAISIGLVDKPNYRKIHNQPIPLIGGITIFISTCLVLALSLSFDKDILAYKNIFICTAILILVGVIDDRFDIRASLKLAIQLILAHFVFMQGIKIESMYGLFGIYEMTPWLQYTFTIIIIAGVVNAFNLMDGVDGLAAGLAIIGLIGFTLLAFLTGRWTMVLVFSSIIGSLVAFLRYNLSKTEKIFMGDAGSLSLGFVLVTSGIILLQSAHDSPHHNGIFIGVIATLILPVLDAIRVFRGRMKAGYSPFKADRTHLHHLILATGLKHQSATVAILIVAVVMIALALVGSQFVGITLSIAAVMMIYYVITAFLGFNNKIELGI